MAEKMKQRCIYCGGDIYYRGSEQLVKCSLCGHTLIVAKFENEIARMKKTEEENAIVKEKLAEAEKGEKAVIKPSLLLLFILETSFVLHSICIRDSEEVL